MAVATFICILSTLFAFRVIWCRNPPSNDTIMQIRGNRPSIVVHSSGSTGVPRPIIQRSLLLIARTYRLLLSYHIQNWYLLFALSGIASIVSLPSGFPYGLPTIFPPGEFPLRPKQYSNTLTSPRVWTSQLTAYIPTHSRSNPESIISERQPKVSPPCVNSKYYNQVVLLSHNTWQ